jgi:amino acid transporter
MTGWASLAAGVVFQVSASSLAGTYTLNLLGQIGWVSPDRVNDQVSVAVMGSLWFAVVTFIVVIGISAAVRLQGVLLAIEYVIVVGFSILAIVRAYGLNPVAGSRHVSLA